MYNRYIKSDKIINNSEEYKDLLQKKDLNILLHYSGFKFKDLKEFEDQELDYIYHKILPGERLYQISQKYYNSPEFGWIICYTNEIANETLLYVGKELKIYYPIETLLRII